MRVSHNPDSDLTPPSDTLEKGSNGLPIERLAEEAIYAPTDKEKRLKARYWSLASSSPLVDPKELTYPQVRALLGTDSLQASWRKGGFKAWFLDTEEHRSRVDYLFGLALDAAEDVLLNTDPKAQSARVNMIRVISDLAGKMPSRNSPANGFQGAIASMDKAQLALFLEKNGVQLQLSASKGGAEKADTITIDAKDGE